MHRSILTPRVLRDNLALAIVLLLCAGGQAAEKPAGSDPSWYMKKATLQETVTAAAASIPPDPQWGPWHLVGPFPNPDGKGFEKAYPPEAGVDLSAQYDGMNTQRIGWVKKPGFVDGQAHDLRPHVTPNTNVTVYLYRSVTSAVPFEIPALFGSDDTLTVWLNGEKLLASNKSRACHLGDDRAELKLKPGVNHLLLKVCQGTLNFEFAFQTTTGDVLLCDLLRRDFPREAAAWQRDRFLPTEELTAAKPFIVFIFVGHSVMRGNGRQTVKDIDVDIWDFDTSTGRGPWRRFASEGDKVGPAKPFLQELAKAYPDYRFGAIRVVADGTEAASYQKDTKLFARIVQCVKSVGSSAQIAGVATCLGWMETQDVKKAPLFLPNYLRFIADLRQALGTPDLPILASHIEGAWEGTHKDKGSWSIINKAYKTLPDQVKYLQVIPVDGIPTYDTHHFTTEGDAIWGQRAMKTAQALDAVGRARKLWDQRPIAASAFVPQTRPDEATDEKAPVAAVVRAKLIRHSRSRSLEQLGPYTQLLVVSEYRIVEVEEGRLDERDIIVIQHSVSDRKPTLAMTAKVGETHLLTLVPWASQRKLHGLATDDDLVEIERDRYYARRSSP